jgi:DHA2 family multidrug resistance protein
MITISVMLATIMQALDTTIANVALPHMQGALSATMDQVSWVLTSYIVAAAIMTAPTGFLAGLIGRKRLFLFSIIGFTLASILCGAAMNLDEMILFRVIQGICGAALVPLSQSVLLDINPPERHGPAMAMWGVGVMLGPILGPTLGGYLTEYYNWRWVFYINVPIGIAAVLGVLAFMPETKRTEPRPFDFLGFAFLSIFIGGLQMMLDRGETKDWFSSTEVVAEATAAGLCLYLFLVHMMTTKHPFLPPAMFKDRNYAVSLLFMFVLGIIILASMALLPPFLQNLMGYPVVLSGIVMAPRGVGTMMAMAVVGKLVGRIDARILIFVGLSLTAYSLYEMSLFTIDVPVREIVYTGVVQGIGMGFIFVPLSTLAYATLPRHFRDDAAAIFSLVRNIGSSVGVSIVMALLSRNIQINHSELASRLVPFGNMGDMLHLLSNAMQGTPGVAVLSYLDGAVNVQASAISYLNDFRLMTYVVLAALPLLLLVRPARKKNGGEAVIAME